MVSAAPGNTILQRMIDPNGRQLPAEVARFFLELEFTEADETRIAELSEKANDGELSPAEHEELATYVLLGDFLTIMHSTAKRSMQSSPHRTFISATASAHESFGDGCVPVAKPQAAFGLETENSR